MELEFFQELRLYIAPLSFVAACEKGSDGVNDLYRRLVQEIMYDLKGTIASRNRRIRCIESVMNNPEQDGGVHRVDLPRIDIHLGCLVSKKYMGFLSRHQLQW